MNSSRFVFLFVILSVVLSSCSLKPSHVLSEKKMVAVFQDLYLVDAIMKNRKEDFLSDRYKDALIHGVLSKHGITQAQLDSSLVWYADNIDVYTQIQDTVNVRLQKKSTLLTQLNSSSYNYKLTGFEEILPEHFVLDVNNPTFRFKIDSIKFESFAKDKFSLSFDVQGVDSIQHRIESSVYYKYIDTTVIDKKIILENKYYVFDRPQLADSLLREVSGYIHMVMATDRMPRVLLNNIQNTNVSIKKDTVALISDIELLDEMLSSTK